jgi:L-cystine transport system permease protein
MFLLSWAFFTNNFLRVLSGLPLTLYISVMSVFFGILLGLVLAFLRIKKTPGFYGAARVFVSFGRSVPMIVVLYLLYCALPLMLHSEQGHIAVQLPPNVVAIAAFSIFSGTYLSESFRSAYYAVGRQQTEAGLSVGMTNALVLRRIIIPQAFRSCIPNFTSVIIDTIKGTAIVYNISIFEIMGLANLVASRSYRFIESYLITLIIYLVVCFTVYLALKRVEIALYQKY